MSKINALLDVGKRSMMNSQTALQTVGHNIANKSTEGYSRQRVELQSNEPIGVGKLRIGMGSKSAAVTRTNNPYLEKQIGKEQAGLGYLSGKADAMVRVEQVYNEQANKGLNQFVTDFFNAFRELSNSPENVATRTLVKETADFLTRDFGRVNNQLKEIQADIDQQIATHVEEVNSYTSEIADLNERIQLVEINGAPANDERDRRDLLIKKLGEKINIRWAEGTDGMVAISAGTSALLVSGHESKQLQVAATSEAGNKREGNFDIFYIHSDKATPVAITNQLKGGAIGGLLEVRDETITGLLDSVDAMAYQLGSRINEAHRIGFDAYNRQGVDFFELPTEVRNASQLIKVNQAIHDDVGRIVTAADTQAPGDNRIANLIAGLQHEKTMDGGAATVDDFYNSMVGQVGVMVRRTNTAQESQRDIVAQLTNIRESISGVSLDEETTKMIEFQKSFDASARLIRTADEMFDTVLNLKRY